MRFSKSQKDDSFKYVCYLVVLIFILVPTSQIYPTSTIDAIVNNDFSTSIEYSYYLFKEIGDQDFSISPSILGGYSPPNAAIVKIESLEENTTGFFGRIAIIDEYSMSTISENRTAIQNITNLFFWKYTNIQSWKQYAEFYHNKTINAVFHTISLDILSGELFEIREYPNNITEHIFVDTFNKITTRIEWHNKNMVPTDRDTTTRFSFENSIILELIQDDDSNLRVSTSFPIITVCLILGTNGGLLLFIIKKVKRTFEFQS